MAWCGMRWGWVGAGQGQDLEFRSVLGWGKSVSGLGLGLRVVGVKIAVRLGSGWG